MPVISKPVINTENLHVWAQKQSKILKNCAVQTIRFGYKVHWSYLYGDYWGTVDYRRLLITPFFCKNVNLKGVYSDKKTES